MIWRAVAIGFSMFVALVWAGANIYQERIPDGLVSSGPTGINEPLRHLQYRATNRNDNFQIMGLDETLADLATAEARKLDPMKKRFRKLLKNQALDIGKAFCPTSSDLPQPYAALEFLVLQDAGQRRVVNARNEIFAFEAQNWFSESNPESVYRSLEITQKRRADATLMGVTAILTAREQEAFNRRGPWGEGLFASGFAGVESETPAIRIKTARDFALMHLLTELANQNDGICAQ